MTGVFAAGSASGAPAGAWGDSRGSSPTAHAVGYFPSPLPRLTRALDGRRGSHRLRSSPCLLPPTRRDSIPQPRVAKRTLGWCSRSQRSTPKALHTRPPAAPPAPAAVSNPFRVLIPVFLHLPGVRFATPSCGMQRLRRRRGMPCKPNTAAGWHWLAAGLLVPLPTRR
jgi:hypothetical protein